MHIACEQHALAHITAIAARIAPRRPSHPSLAGVKLTAQDGELTATSYDGGRAVSYTVTATVFEPGEALVSAWLLGEIAKQAAARPVTLTRSGHRVYVECDASRYTLPTLPLEDYPTLPELPPEAGLASASNLADAISRVAPAAATPTSKAPPALQGVVLEADATHLTLVATDAYQLATARVPWRSAGAPLPAPIVVQANHLAEVARALGQGTVRLHANDATLGLTTDALRVTTRLMDARPPRWRRVLPSPGEAATIVRTHRATLAAAVRRITPVLDGGPAPRVLLRTHADTTDTLEVLGGGDSDTTAAMTVDAEIAGEPMCLAINPAYLTAALAATPAEDVEMRWYGTSRPALLTPPTQSATHPGMQYLVMPIRCPNTTTGGSR